MRVEGLGFGLRVPGSGFRVQGSGHRVERFRVQGSGFRVQGSESRVQGSEFRVQGSGCRVEYLRMPHAPPVHPPTNPTPWRTGLRVEGWGLRVGV